MVYPNTLIIKSSITPTETKFSFTFLFHLKNSNETTGMDSVKNFDNSTQLHLWFTSLIQSKKVY